jgi:hypothetical protein
VHPANPIYRLLWSGQLALRTHVRRAGGVGPGPITRGAIMVGIFHVWMGYVRWLAMVPGLTDDGDDVVSRGATAKVRPSPHRRRIRCVWLRHHR